jgi:hypothetical protein
LCFFTASIENLMTLWNADWHLFPHLTTATYAIMALSCVTRLSLGAKQFADRDERKRTK